MKNIYIFLFLTTKVTFISCMEQEKPKRRTSYEVQFPSVNPSTILPVHTLSMYPDVFYTTPMHTNNAAQTQTQNIPTCEANQPGWQQLNKIMNTRYQSDQPDCVQEVELKPIYRPASTKKTIDAQEKKPFLPLGIAITCNKQLMDKIYIEASEISSTFTLKSFTSIVTMMNKAKTEHITETVMGNYAYTLWLPYKNSQKQNYEKTAKRAPVLFFGYLKHYNQTVNTTKEQLPKLNNIYRKTSSTKVNNRLAQKLNLSSSANKKHEEIIYDEAHAIKNYHAFAALKQAIDLNLTKQCNHFLSYIYSEDNTPHNKYLNLSYDKLKSEMYEKAINRDTWNLLDDANFIYDMIQIIEAGKTLIPAKQEHDFGYDIIESEQTFTGQLFSFANIDYTSKTRKRIGMLCHLIQTYNDERKAKKSPTMEQYLAHKEYLQLCPFYLTNLSVFAFPDSFDHKLLDEKIYAFDELKKLTDMVWTLKSATDENVQECVDQIYPPRK